MQYSPKLKKAMSEIKAIINKYDIAAIVVLHNAEGTEIQPDGSIFTQGFTEYIFHINPSYSAADIVGTRFKVKGKAAHYSSPEERDRKMSATVNMMDHLSEWTAKMAMYDGVKKMVEQIDTDPGEHTSHDQQNN